MAEELTKTLRFRGAENVARVSLLLDLALMQKVVPDDDVESIENREPEPDLDASDQAIQLSTESAWVIKPGAS